MALLNQFPIRWKLSGALIATGLTLILVYVIMAKRVFETDKIAYVFDSQSSKLESTKREIEGHFERALLSARTIIATFDSNMGQISPVGERIFAEEKILIALDLWNEQIHQSIFQAEKEEGVLPPPNESASPLNELSIELLNNEKFLIELRYPQGESEVFRLRAVLEFSGLLPKAEMSQSFALMQDGKVLFVSDFRNIERSIVDQIAVAISEGPDRTLIWGAEANRFLVTGRSLSFGHLRLLTFTPEKEALGALSTLFRRSMIFLLFSTFCLIAVSLTLARGLTLNLSVMTRAADEVGQGKFDDLPVIESADEMGVLSRAFVKMSQEIKRLLFETREKARMEAELKTASLIQERLLPLRPKAEFGELEVSGLVLTSSECGGDWWYYFAKGDDLYVAIADATGHGTPAALITAAARSIFSRFEVANLSLREMMMAWDFALTSCSQRQVLMTGMLFRFNTKTGEGAFFNAAHETPFVIRDWGGKFKIESLPLNASNHLGNGFGTDTLETFFRLGPNESLILYTDGLFAISRPDGRQLSGVRFSKQIEAHAHEAKSADSLNQFVLKTFNEFRQDVPLPDDVSIVTVRRKGISL